jgi:hypothetical protein
MDFLDFQYNFQKCYSKNVCTIVHFEKVEVMNYRKVSVALSVLKSLVLSACCRPTKPNRFCENQ